MTGLLVRLFVKNSGNTTDPEVRRSYGKLAGGVGLVTNLLLSLAKLIFGTTAASIAIIADGINNLTDAASSVVALIGFKLAAKSEDKEHPYGHGRYEYIAGMAVSILIIIAGAQLLKSSVEKIFKQESLTVGNVTIVILIAAILIKVWLTLFNTNISRSINSAALKATGTDSRNDVITTAVVLAGIIINKLWNINIDGYLGCAVAVFIIWSGIQLIRETSDPLLGKAPDPILVNEISSRLNEADGILGIHDLEVHDYGPGRIFASVHAEVDASSSMLEVHDMIDNQEWTIAKELGINITIHMDPVSLNDPVTDRLKKFVSELIQDIDGIDSFHDLRVVPGPTHTNVVFDLVILPDCKLSHQEITIIVQNAFDKSFPEYYTVINFDSAYTFL